MRISICVFLLSLSSLVWAEEPFRFHLPSSVGLSVMGDSEQTRSSLLNFQLSLPGQTMLFGTLEKTRLLSEDEETAFEATGGSLGMSSDPLGNYVGSVEVMAVRIDKDVETEGARFVNSVLLGPVFFTLGLEGYVHKFSHLPKLLFPGGESNVYENAFRVEIETYILAPVTLRVFGAHHHYDTDLADYAEGLRVLAIPSNILTTVTGFPESEGGLAAEYSASRYSVGVQVASAKSALDQLKTIRSTVLGSYVLSSSWSVNGSVGAIKTENPEDEDGQAISQFLQLGVTYSWD